MIGFTSRTFVGAITRGETTLEETVAWAVSERFQWMEVRDLSLSFTGGELRGLVEAASKGNMRLHYAWDGTNILDPADGRLFLRGVRNRLLFRSVDIRPSDDSGAGDQGQPRQDRVFEATSWPCCRNGSGDTSGLPTRTG